MMKPILKFIFRQMEKSAAGGDLGSMVIVANYYKDGLIVAQDYTKAREWYEKAAAKGDGKASFWIGYFYHKGLGAAQDLAKAREWYEKAAVKGDPIAMNNLGHFYHEGQGGTQDFSKAREWYEKAAAKANEGNREAKNNLVTFTRNLAMLIQDEERLTQLSLSMAKLDSLIGLTGVKAEITNLVNLALFNKKRAEQSLPPLKLALHLVFTGNPGTGKTTVARLVGDIYASLGLLHRGHVVETDKSGLVAMYLGQTPTKTKEVIDSALDGVLFIDEAYSLTRPGVGNQYGQEAVETLLKEMEDKRDRLAVIVAGYPNEMSQFISSNPGLESRFTTFIHFDDYSPDELGQIFARFANNEGLKLSGDAQTKVQLVCQALHDAKGEVFGNGRTVRNLFEQTIKNVAARVATGDTNLEEIKAQDIPGLATNGPPNNPGRPSAGER
jgi:TPR repeat protein